MLVLRNYAKRYQGTLVLEFKELMADRGIHWIKGSNGSGKSTLFKSIAAIIPFDGEITLGDINLKRHPIAYRKLVNFAEAEPAFPGFLTAKDLIRFIGKTKNATLRQQDLYTKAFCVDEFFNKPCDTYSSGMMKKLSLVLAFLGDPKLIILDEPLITLDESSRKVLMSMILNSVDKGIMFLISSHQLLDDFPLPITGSYSIRNKTLVVD